jgi:hypothetical protein
LPDGSFRYHHILRDFLRRTAAEQELDLTGCYIASADFMSDKGKFNEALDYYVKSGDLGALNRFLRRIVDYDFTMGGVEEYTNSITNFIINKLPAEIIESNIILLAPCVWASLMSGDIEQFKHWLARLQTHLCTKENIDQDYIRLSFCLNFRTRLTAPAIFLSIQAPKLIYRTLRICHPHPQHIISLFSTAVTGTTPASQTNGKSLCPSILPRSNIFQPI